jgi:hypothetical protein
MGLILLPGEVATGATGPPDWTIRALPLPGDAQGRYVVHATRPPPGLAPGTTLAIRFTTRAPLGTNRAREIRFSPTCVVGSDVVKQSSGPPPPPPPPPPKPRPCKCESLTVGLGPDSKRDRRHHQFLLVWDLECTGGAGGCSGRLEAQLPAAERRKGVRIRLNEGDQHAVEWRLNCRGSCPQRRVAEGSALLDVTASPNAPFGAKIGAIRIRVERFCKRQRAPQIIRIAFNPDGRISQRRSDLNGNGVADGKEKRKT